MTLVRITVLRIAGSAPREAGTVMHVGPDSQTGTIGGGALEYRATRTAREMLETGRPRFEETIPLGPDLGQCCGGSVRLGYEIATDEAGPAPTRPLWIWGAGHVGRALVATAAPLPDFDITWVDFARARFPDEIPVPATPLWVENPAALLPHTPRDAAHLIVTHSHALDLELCHGLLDRGFAYAGLIGSRSKWARFRKRLRALGHADARIASITCPIGAPELGKHPQAIAVSTVAELLAQAATQAGRKGRKGQTG